MGTLKLHRVQDLLQRDNLTAGTTEAVRIEPEPIDKSAIAFQCYVESKCGYTGH